ncbi:hypothetical protein CERZMDRAFT_100038 [Cercospora zeae-maydis SCOH1-5]|uniref:DUF427 domain-containing protein n=1 Tax=Cercospora zeae-maydis SCOH1-5 TaxID=717836 RepID=A0A6A6F9B9_9PEZI|nr:hypothetical protein CERZMDRAFT_100038 [Cercospora zeae-maydis SCOH1-5]
MGDGPPGEVEMEGTAGGSSMVMREEEGGLSSDLKSLTIKLATQGPHKTLPTPRLIQLLFNGVYMLKTTAAIYVWEHPYYPQLYFPASVLHSYFAARSADLQISPGENIAHPENPAQIFATQWTIIVRKKKIDKVVCFANKESLPEKARELAGLVRIDFASVDQWFEESTPIFVHPKDPFKRVDILQSTRHVVVKLPLGRGSHNPTSADAAVTTSEANNNTASNTGPGATSAREGEEYHEEEEEEAEDEESNYRVIADTFSSMHLYETGLPCRFYIPLTRVDASVLRKSSTKTSCPYKGAACYYDVVLPSSPSSPNPTSPQQESEGRKDEIVFKDIIWYYPTPLLESAKISDLVCFYNEKVRIEVDGEVLEQPVTPFSRGGAGGEDKEKFLLSSLSSSSLLLDGQIHKRERGEGDGNAGAGAGAGEDVLDMGSLGKPLGPLKEERGSEG